MSDSVKEGFRVWKNKREYVTAKLICKLRGHIKEQHRFYSTFVYKNTKTLEETLVTMCSRCGSR